MRKIVQCNMAVLALVLASACAAGTDTGDADATVATVSALQPWRAVDASTGQISDAAGLEQLACDFPNSSSVRLRLLNAHLGEEDLSSALEDIRWLYQRGYVLSEGAQGQLLGMYDGEQAEELAGLFGSAASPIAASEVATRLPDAARLPESLVVLREDFFIVTDVVARGRWSGQDGEWAFYSPDWLGNPSGIAALGQAELWTASADLGMLPADEEVFSGLFAATNRLPMTIPAPEGVNLSDIAVGPDHTVYASDPLGGGVYKLPQLAQTIETLVPPGTLRSPQGVAPSEDGSRLYISDYRYGLAVIDVATGAVSRLPVDFPVLLDGIDGLWLHQGELIAVQNGISPMRIVALALSEDGNRITGMRVLERANPVWTEPLGGSIYEGALYYIGNGQWDKFAEGGALREGAELVPTQIRRLELGETNP